MGRKKKIKWPKNYPYNASIYGTWHKAKSQGTHFFGKKFYVGKVKGGWKAIPTRGKGKKIKF